MKKKIIISLLLAVTILMTVGCEKNNTKELEYSGTYKNEDTSYIKLEKDKTNYKGTISIYRLATFDYCSVNDIKDDILKISCIDPNENPIKFSFNYNNKKLTVEETTWNLINKGDTFDFNK